MKITVNGKPRSLSDAASVTALLDVLKVKPEQVAVAINGQVVRRRDWPQTSVREGDVVEVVRAVGGGAR
ncbi:MAG TPA: sulfur carrier protein ThiS [Dehalococcoidia bacterium]|nr:sulfur carrier protein ThiS [Dehalococcoidia bacterium]